MTSEELERMDSIDSVLQCGGDVSEDDINWFNTHYDETVDHYESMYEHYKYHSGKA